MNRFKNKWVMIMLLSVINFSLFPQASCVTGTYTGTGSTLSITSVGFQPDAVIIKSSSNSGKMYIKTSAMASTASRAFISNSGMVTNAITALGSTGFTLGTNAEVNTSGTTYYFSAFRVSSSVRVGSYTGNGSDPQNITFSSSAQGGYVMVIPNGSDGGYAYYTANGTGWNYFYDNGTSSGSGNSGTGAPSNGFNATTAGNTNGVTYYYLAWVNTTGKCQVGSYSGNTSDNRNITLSGTTFQPNFMVISNSIGQVMRTGSYGATDATQYCTATADAANLIQAFNSNGFQVGNNSSTTNGSGWTFCYLAMGGLDVSVLPVDLIYFKANCIRGSHITNLYWATASEQNNDYFILERSTNAIDFVPVAYISGYGNSNELRNYCYTDTSSFNVEAIYYRLIQVDYNGEKTYYPLITPDCEISGNPFDLFIAPYPVENNILQYTLQSSKAYSMKADILDTNGKIIRSETVLHTGGILNYSIQLSGLHSGIYLIRIHNGYRQVCKKFILQ